MSVATPPVTRACFFTRERARRPEKGLERHAVHGPDFFIHLRLPLALFLPTALGHEPQCRIRIDQLVVYGIREHSRDCGANQPDGVFGIPGLSLGRDQSFEMPPPYLAKLDGSKRLSLDSEGKHVTLQELLVASERLGLEAVAVCIQIMIDVARKWHLGPESRLRVGSLAALLQLTIQPL